MILEKTKGFLRASGRYIVNEGNEQVVLRGFGAANWQNPEGFMIGAPKMESLEQVFPTKDHNYNRFDRRRSVTQVVRELCGSRYLENFWDRWESNHLNENDIKAMSEMGMNSVRLVLNANALLYEEPGITYNEKGFGRLTEIIDYCEKYSIYAILDMHASVGGICGCCGDALHFGYPSSLYDEESRERNLILWEEIAKRYEDRWIVAGYDLMNEPVSTPPEYFAYGELERYYRDAIERIRKVDEKHIIFLEGPNFARGLQIFDKDYDPGYHNWCMSIHAYDASPELKSIYPYLLKSIEFDVPIWIGESGADTRTNSVFFDVCNQLGIGYSIWCWKQADEGSGSYRAIGHHLPKDWELVRSYCAGGARPSYEKSQTIFDEYIENLRYENCSINETYSRLSFKKGIVTIPGTGYDMFLEDGTRYLGNWMWGNFLNFRMEDHTKLVWAAKKEKPFPPFMIYPTKTEKYDPLGDLALELTENEFANYTSYKINDENELTLTAASMDEAIVEVKCNGEIVGTIEIEKSSITNPVETKSVKLEENAKVILTLTVVRGTVQIVSVNIK